MVFTFFMVGLFFSALIDLEHIASVHFEYHRRQMAEASLAEADDVANPPGGGQTPVHSRRNPFWWESRSTDQENHEQNAFGGTNRLDGPPLVSERLSGQTVEVNFKF